MRSLLGGEMTRQLGDGAGIFSAAGKEGSRFTPCCVKGGALGVQLSLLDGQSALSILKALPCSIGRLGGLLMLIG